MKIVQYAGFILWILFYGSYFLKMMLQKNKGIKAGRLAKGIKKKRTFYIEVFLKIITFVIAFVQLFCIWRIQDFKLHIFFIFSDIIGLAIALSGTLFFIFAMICMRLNWRAGIDLSQRTSIVTTGIYHISRNPAFLGFDLFYIGLTITFPSLLMIILSAIGIIMMHIQILEEERYLPAIFGKKYEIYRRRTPRYFLFF